MLSIRLPADIESRLGLLAEKTGRSKSFYVREAILDRIDDMEDFYLVDLAMDRIRKGQEAVLTADQMWNGLDD